MKVLVTGGGGFLGRHIVRLLLLEGADVVIFQRQDHPDLAAEGVSVRRGSLLEEAKLLEAMRGCDAVIHTAAKAGVWGDRETYFSINYEGTRAVCRTMQSLGIRRLVHCSTPSVVFNREAFAGADETLPYGRDWLCAYAESKALAEQHVLEWARAGNGHAIALRPHLIWGRGDPHLLPKVIGRAAGGRLRIVGDGANRVDVTRVENAAAAHLLALKALERPDARNRPYFISQGEPVVLWDWINDLLGRVGVEPLKNKISLKAAYRIGAVCELFWRLAGSENIPPMTRFVALELGKDHWFSIKAARELLGYSPEAFPMEDGLARYAADWKDGRTPRD